MSIAPPENSTSEPCCLLFGCSWIGKKVKDYRAGSALYWIERPHNLLPICKKANHGNTPVYFPWKLSTGAFKVLDDFVLKKTGAYKRQKRILQVREAHLLSRKFGYRRLRIPNVRPGPAPIPIPPPAPKDMALGEFIIEERLSIHGDYERNAGLYVLLEPLSPLGERFLLQHYKFIAPQAFKENFSLRPSSQRS